MTIETLMTVDDLCEYLAVEKKTLYNWKHQGIGPPVVKVGGLLRYRGCDVTKWVDQQACKEVDRRRSLSREVHE